MGDPGAGYGFESDRTYEGDCFFFYTDHLGSTSYLTDTGGNASQFVCYTPYGEAIVDEHLTSYENPFKFSGKELDDITGLYDHGARSRNPISTLWYGVDPRYEEFPENSPYNYCFGNPVKLVDMDGECPAAGAVFIPGVGEVVVVGACVYFGVRGVLKLIDYCQSSSSNDNNQECNNNTSGCQSSTGSSSPNNNRNNDKNKTQPSGDNDSKKIKYERSKAVKEAWKDEKKMVEKTGRGTRPWKPNEIKELKNTGKVKGYEGHHIKDVKTHPQDAGNPNNIKFVKGRKGHIKEHNGNFRNPTEGEFINRKTE